MAIHAFNRANTALVAADINAALQEVAKKHNITIPPVDLRNCRSGTFARLYKMDIKAPIHDQQINQTFAALGVSPEQAARVLPPHSLEAAMQRDGIISKTNAKGDVLDKYKHGNKYCYGYTSARGTPWLIPVSEAQKRFGYRPPVQTQSQPSATV